jgi:hypothetical protein
LTNSNQTYAIAYLARGADKESYASFGRFLDSYRRNPAGIDHSLYVIFKGFANNADLRRAQNLFAAVPHQPVFLSDDKLDVGAYIEWADLVEEDAVCVFNTASEILAHDWLSKFAGNLAMPNVGLVGATASYESLHAFSSVFPLFPNFHIRSTAFMIDRGLFLSLMKGRVIASKVDAFHFESGPNSLTRLILAEGREVLVVGRNGRGYSPQFWPTSGTFRQGTQSNLLIGDNQTRSFSAMPWMAKRAFALRTWGKYLEYQTLFPA